MPNSEAPTTSVSQFLEQAADVTEGFGQSTLVPPSFPTERREGINVLRRQLLTNKAWHVEKLAKVNRALELLEDDEAYSIYEAIWAAR